MSNLPRVDPADARYLYSGRVSASPHWAIGTHLHPFHEIVCVLRGRYWAMVGGREVRARGGEVLFYRAGAPHEEASGPDDPAETIYIGFEWPDAPARLPVAAPDRRGRIGPLAHWLHEDRDAGDAAARDRLLEVLLREFAAPPPEEPTGLVDAVRRFFAGNLAEPIALEDAARAAGLSKHHFLRRYHALAGRTPMEDLRRMRIEHARHLILTTDLPLKAIPPLAGLGDQHQMTRLFRRHLGMTPGGLRRRAPGSGGDAR